MSEPKAGLVVPLVEVKGGDELNERLLLLLQMEKGLNVVVEPGFEPETPGIHLLCLPLLLRHKVARHDNSCFKGVSNSLHRVHC